MKKRNYLFSYLFSCLLILSFSINAQSRDNSGNNPLDSLVNVVVPNDYATIPGTSTFLGPLANATRRYQLIIHESQLTGLLGADLTSINFRIPTSATEPWPTTAVSFPSYVIYLSLAVAPQNASLTFANNIAGPQTMVRSGVLDINAGSYPSGSSPNLWGTNIEFQTPYAYTGGHLLIDIMHTGFSGTSRSVDAIGTAITGYGTLFSARWASSLTAETGSQGNFAAVKINGINIIPVELTSFTAQATENGIEIKWTTATETNNRGFEILRSFGNNDDWQLISFIEGHGTTTQQQSYIYVDNPSVEGKYFYRLKQMDYDGAINYSNEIEVNYFIPTEFALHQNYPNPFNPSTTIKYSLLEQSRVVINVYNTLGEMVAELVNTVQNTGKYAINFNGKNLTSGVYFYSINAEPVNGGKSFNQVKKMIIIK